MKKLIYILFLILLPIFSLAQKENYYQHNTEKQIRFYKHKDWTLENEGEWGSFYWKIIRSSKDSDDYYWYYVYLYSNSYFNTKTNNEYDKAITYIKNMVITMYIYKNKKDKLIYINNIPIKLPYVVCDYKLDESLYVAYFYSTSKYNSFNLKFEGATAFDYSETK